MHTIIPAILTEDKVDAQKKMLQVASHVSWIHIDIMDGAFVNNATLAPQSFQEKPTEVSLEAHLMVQDPVRYVDAAIKAGFKRIIFHIETTVDPLPIIETIKNNGIEAGLALSPQTPIERALPYLDVLDTVLVMSVNPGWGGQTFIPKTLEKIRNLSKIIKEKNVPTRIAVDGGIYIDNAKVILEAGADDIIAGSAIYKNEAFSIPEAITAFKQLF